MQLVCGMNIGARGFSGGTGTLHTSGDLEGVLQALEASSHTSVAATMLAVVSWLEGLVASAYIRQEEVCTPLGSDGNCSWSTHETSLGTPT